MKLKAVTITVFVMFLLASAVCLGQEANKQDINQEEKIETKEIPDTITTVKDSIETDGIPEQLHKVIAYYFHGSRRCSSCRKIEAYSQEAIEQGFANELEEGKLEWIVINTDLPQNKRFVEDYQLYTKSLIISKVEDGKQIEWKNLEKVWELLRNKKAFLKYVQDEVRALLGEN